MPARGSTIDATYNARHLLVLEGLEAVRKGEIATDQEVEAVFAKYRQA